MQANMRFIRNVLYRLKRQYGTAVILYKTLTKDVDPKTGKKAMTRSHTAVDLAIVLPDTLANKFAYEHSFLAANRKFTYGAQWDQRQRLVVIDGYDLPEGYKIELEDSLVFNGERYTINKADQFDSGYGYLLTVVRADNNLPLQIIDLTVSQRLCLGQSAGTS
jgi:hypothetical protein